MEYTKDTECNYCIVLYTHETYQDIFDICIKLHEKYTSDIHLIIFSNKLMNTTYPHILYKDSSSYAERLYHCINKLPINIKHIIISHDWAFVYDKIVQPKIENAIQEMIVHNIHQLRLLKASVGENTPTIANNIYRIDTSSSYLFSVQPTIWEINAIKQITRENIGLDYRNIELSLYSYMCQFNNCFYYEGEPVFPEASHHISNIYPYIHTTRYGKWILRENMPFIQNIIDEFGINIDIRGYY